MDDAPLTLGGLGLPRGGLYAFAYGDSDAWKRVGAAGFMDLARSMRHSVNMSAANLGLGMLVTERIPAVV